MLLVTATLVLAGGLHACATLGEKPRRSSAGCARAALAEITPFEDAGDKRAHCLGAARIAQRCSVVEAALASYAKELRDLLGRGDAQLADIRAGHAGIRCARAHAADADHGSCCETEGF